MELARPIRGWNYGAIRLALFLILSPAFSQNAAPIVGATIPAKPLAFEVTSIHPSKPGTNAMTRLAINPDGYSVTGQSIAATIMIAYFPQGAAYWSRDRLTGAPMWLMNDLYDISAKVSDAELVEWQRQGVTSDKAPMFREMLRTMLADRCHLIAHMVPGRPISGWAIETGKHPLHLAESNPGETLPAGMKFSDGGIMIPAPRGDKPQFRFYAATMADLAQVLSSSGHPVQDHTGLTGHYDLVLDWIGDPDSKLPGADDPDRLLRWNFDALGLQIVPVKVPMDTLVIDHIEKPSTN